MFNRLYSTTRYRIISLSGILPKANEDYIMKPSIIKTTVAAANLVLEFGASRKDAIIVEEGKITISKRFSAALTEAELNAAIELATPATVVTSTNAGTGGKVLRANDGRLTKAPKGFASICRDVLESVSGTRMTTTEMADLVMKARVDEVAEHFATSATRHVEPKAFVRETVAALVYWNVKKEKRIAPTGDRKNKMFFPP